MIFSEGTHGEIMCSLMKSIVPKLQSRCANNLKPITRESIPKRKVKFDGYTPFLKLFCEEKVEQ